MDSRLRQWKTQAPMDLPSRSHWFKYSRAADQMPAANRIPKHGRRGHPGFNDKKGAARTHCIPPHPRHDPPTRKVAAGKKVDWPERSIERASTTIGPRSRNRKVHQAGAVTRGPSPHSAGAREAAAQRATELPQRSEPNTRGLLVPAASPEPGPAPSAFARLARRLPPVRWLASTSAASSMDTRATYNSAGITLAP